MFLSLDGTFWIQLINFAIFFVILNVVFLRPVGAAIRKRREYITGVKSDYERYTHEVQTLRDEADEKRALARREAAEHVVAARAAASLEAERIASGYATRAASLATEARATVEGEIAQARAREGELSQTLAHSILERAIGTGR